MKRGVVVAAVCALLAGCDYTVPLVRTADRPMDDGILGLWQRTLGEGKRESLLVLPLNKKEYLVVFPAESEDAMFARGCLWHKRAITLVQLDWFGTARGKLPDDQRTFQYAVYERDGDRLTVRLLNPDVVARDIASPRALGKAITANADNPELFREKMVFQREPR